MISIGFIEFGFKDLLETLVIAIVLFYLYRWIRGTFAIQAAAGLLFVVILNIGVSILGFSTLNFMLRSMLDVGVRSEERRVGKECRGGWWRGHLKESKRQAAPRDYG